MQYKEQYAQMAEEILSRPLKSKQHVCDGLGISVSDYEKWLTEEPEFEKAVGAGFLKGEVKTRNFLAKAALMQNVKIDLKLLWGLANDIYGIGSGSEEADNAEPVRWRIELVRSEASNTGEAGTIPNEEEAV